MQTVYKYEIPPLGEFNLTLPRGAQILSFQCQRERLTIWALVDPDAPTVRRQFILRGTGHPIELDAIHFIGTAQQANGSLVWHLFEADF